MKQSKTTLIIGIILAVLSTIFVSYQLKTSDSTSDVEALEANDSKPIPMVQKSLSLVSDFVNLK